MKKKQFVTFGNEKQEERRVAMRKGLKILLVIVVLVWTRPALGLSGAVFTTLENGSAVNHNIYEDIEDVYLDGGPGPHAPIGAAGLPEGCYYFQVTDPSGKTLLSTDPVECRCFHVNSDGVIDDVCTASVSQKVKGQIVQVSCAHNTGTDQDHGAVTVQLYPFNETPNNGGVYKVWVTPVECYEQYNGFNPRCCKTDNFKVQKKGKSCDPPVIVITKIDDSDADGKADEEEKEIVGWPVQVTDPLGVTNTFYTPATVLAVPAGSWQICEDEDDDWLCTGPECNNVTVADCSGQTHRVVFCNIQLGGITACKGYDANADGVDDGIPVEGFAICLEGTAVNGETVSDCKYTDCDGCVTFDRLLPGDYTACEIAPENWYASSPTKVSLCLKENAEEQVQFLDYCTGTVYMRTKGFWQNQGCTIVTKEDLDYLSVLAPYKSGTIITKGQDNCGGLACPESVALPLDTVNALGCYIVAPNGQDSKLGLAQQLMAFILNCRHGLDSFGATLILPDGTSYNVQDLIDSAVSAWQAGQDVTLYQGLLDSINNMESGVDCILGSPCPVVY
jgi:hypothetical protein